MTTNSSRLLLLLSKISHFMYQFIQSNLTIISYHLHNYKLFGDRILVGGLLTSLEQNLVHPLHMIATITDTYESYGVSELMCTKK